jgi:hypothetical protein
MAYRFREQYGAVLQKRRWLHDMEAFSEPDEAGSKVSILVPFMEQLVIDQQQDSRECFEGQTEKLFDHYTARGRDPQPVMDARKEDFARVMADKSVPTVVVAGFGNFSAIAIPLSGEREQPFRFGYLDWLHLAGMATHLKLGKFVTLQCCAYYRQFNPPLGAGVASSYPDMLAPLGKGRYAADEWENEIKPITTKDVLSYEEIRESFPIQGKPNIVPDAAFMAIRGVREQMRYPEIPKPEKIPYPDEMRQFVG